MDARERLRLYLEQRRDMGESDLVLDQLAVADVLAMLGATGPARPQREAPRAATPAVSPVVPSENPSAVSSSAPPEVPPRVPSTVPPVSVRESASTPIAAPVPSAAPPAWLAALDVPDGIVVSRHAAEVPLPLQPSDSVANAATLADVADLVASCTRCTLYESAMHHVPGEGNPMATFVCVGEAPGKDEDESGRPFVGASGQLLTKILGAINFSRDDVFICNVVKHRPPGNRNPLPAEVAACRPFLEQQLALLKPRVILALGTFAAQTLLDTADSLGSLRGRVHRYHGIPLIATYHPAALLRNEAWKRPTWDDVQLARRIHDASLTAQPELP